MLIVTVDANCQGEPTRYLREFSAGGRDLGPMMRRCLVVGRDEGGYDVVRESFSPTWGPSGARLLFTESGLGIRHISTTPEGRDRRPIELPPDANSVTFHPDGEQVVFLRAQSTGGVGRVGWAVWTQRVDGTQPQELGKLPAPSTLAGFGDWLTPEWSPDGRFVAVVADPWGNPSTTRGIWLMDASTGKLVRRLARNGVEPDWSPDGRRLVYRTDYGFTESDTAGFTGADLFVVSRNGGRPRRLVRTRRSAAFSPTYAPDGRTIAWARVVLSGSESSYDVDATASIMRIPTRGRARPRRVAPLPPPIVDAESMIFNEPTLAWQPRPALRPNP